MKKYLKYYPSDSQYVISNETPCVSYCAQEDELHYSNVPNLGETIEDLLQFYNVQNVEDFTFYIQDIYLYDPNYGSIGVLVNQFQAYIAGYNVTDLEYETTYTFDYNKLIINNTGSGLGISKIFTNSILKQLDGKAKIIIHSAGD